MSKITVQETENEIVITIQKETKPAFDGSTFVKNIILDTMNEDYSFKAAVRG